ncbi:MAG: bifunctional [glutamate--ammonia ligase]-adenylyl-L-tyrosine phosphorylase/[glutamate--ammonia-ligase] adenylyltransferase [Pseudomonadota bacterium]
MTATNAQVPGAAIEALPGELREPTRRWFERLVDDQGYRGSLPESLVRLVAVSEFAAAWLMREPEWIDALYRQIDAPIDVAYPSSLAEDETSLKRDLRRWRHRCLIQLLWRELEYAPPAEETIGQLSALAESLLIASSDYATTALTKRFGTVADKQGAPSEVIILGMGKLGGRELNFSSDIDIVFLFSRNGETDGAKSLSAEEYFTRFARIVVGLLDEVTEDGFAFRVDTRLRPFGDSGPPVTSLSALEAYLLKHGRDWERYAYVKARVVGPVVTAATAAELFDQIITPFVYRRYLDFGVFDSLRNMHAMIAAEVKKKALADNIKLGRGGIRDVEFAVQSLQLVRGGRDTALQAQGLLTVLPLLAATDALDDVTAEHLRRSYAFLRRVENLVQAMRDRQTHDLPTDPTDRARLVLAMGYVGWDQLLADLNQHRETVAAVFTGLAFGEADANSEATLPFSDLFATRAARDEWTAALSTDCNAQDAAALAMTLVDFAAACDKRQIDSVSVERLNRFIDALVARVLQAQSPVRALQRTLSVIENVLRRSAYISLLNENPHALDHLVTLCEQSTYLTQQLGRYPALLDELLDPRIYAQPATRGVLEAEICDRLHAAAGDSEAQTEALARFQRASQFRIAAADFSGELPLMRVSDLLTETAEVVLEEALRMAWRDMCERYGVPSGGSHDAANGFGIVAYGKLGGLELSYGSDLDLVFLHDLGAGAETTSDSTAIENGVFLSRLVRRLVHILSTQTGSGVLYEIDTRLRPDGQSGLLVSHIDAFERYQMNDAWTWEHQSLLRARPVGGDPAISARFDEIRTRILVQHVDQSSLKHDVLNMRRKMRQSLDTTDQDQFDLKQGAGGIGDIEFLVQYLVLREAPRNPSVVEYSDNIRQIAALATCGCLDITTASGLQDIYRAYRLRAHHLALDASPSLVPNAEFGDERATISQLWADILGA